MTPRLFEPITLREKTFRNRIWLAPMCQYSCESDGLVNSWHRQHLVSRAVGGFGLILTEASAVAPEGRISPQDAGIWNDAQRDAWKPIVDEVHAHGAGIGIQLAHAGRKASTYRGFPGEQTGPVASGDGGWTPVGPSPVAFEGLLDPHALTAADIDGVVDAFADAARRADKAGFDVVEIHAAHGYLLHEFLSPASNHRADEYGGSLENRSRLLLRVAKTVREVWPAEKPVFTRISATDWNATGWDVSAATEVAAMLREVGVDLVDVSSGGNVLADIPAEANYQVPFADAVRSGASVATGAVGLITAPAQAEAVLTEGKADAVLLGRVALREPSWPLRAASELGVSWRDAPYPPQYTRGAWDHAPR